MAVTNVPQRADESDGPCSYELSRPTAKGKERGPDLSCFTGVEDHEGARALQALSAGQVGRPEGLLFVVQDEWPKLRLIAPCNGVTDEVPAIETSFLKSPEHTLAGGLDRDDLDSVIAERMKMRCLR